MSALLRTNREQALHEIQVVEDALTQGFPPPGTGNTVQGALLVAAQKLGVARSTLVYRVGRPTSVGIYERYFGLKVDWSKYNPRLEPPPTKEFPTEKTVDEQIIERRQRDDSARLRDENRELQRRVAAAEDIRAEVLGLRDMPPPPVSFPPRERKSARSAETVVLVLSDLQWAEVIGLLAMDGLNSYNPEIARARLGRWANAVCDLLTKHWHGAGAPERIILVLGGDLISGGIHLELAKTDAMRPLPAVRDVAEHIQQAILTIKKNVGCQIDIISLPGNHARTSLKPESKEVAATSLDVLASDFLEMGLRGQNGISFYAPVSPDALFSVYGWRVLASHGDKIGSRGGQGFIGPAATAARGMKRIIADYAARGIHIDLIILGHFHSAMQLEEGFVNGCLCGPSEYSRDGRFRPRPSVQLMFCIHPKHLITQVRWIEVGDPSEGSLYEPPPIDRPLRPRYRIKVTSERA